MGGKPKAGYTIHWDTDSGAVSSVRTDIGIIHRVDSGGRQQ